MAAIGQIAGSSSFIEESLRQPQPKISRHLAYLRT
jgi:hypothetical protein